MRAAFVCRSCQRRLLASYHSSTISRLSSFRPRAFTSLAPNAIQANTFLQNGGLKNSFESRAPPAESLQGVNRLALGARESEAAQSYSTPRQTQSSASNDTDSHATAAALPSEPVASLRDENEKFIYPPLIREMLASTPLEKGRIEHTHPPSARQVPRSPPSRRTSLKKPPLRNRKTTQPSSPRSQIPSKPEKERQREQYQLRLSYSLMQKSGTLSGDLKREFRRWKAQYGLCLQSGSNELEIGKKSPEERRLWELDSEQSIREEWEKSDLRERLQEWPRVMMSTLKHCPQKAHQVLSATLDYRLPPYAVQDSLRIMTSFWRSRPQALNAKDDQGIAKGIVGAFLKVKETFPSMPFEQNTLGLVARALPRPHFHHLFAALNIPLSGLSENTALQFARKLAGAIGETGQASSQRLALEILEHLATRRGECVHSDKFRSVVTPLLHQDSTEDQSHRFDTREAFSRLWDKGFRPNVINLTAYLDTLCLAGDVKHAITAAKMFQEHGLHFDPRLLDILFRGAKYKLDCGMVEDVIQLSKAARLAKWSVLENAMHSIFFFHAAEARQNGKYQERDLKPFLPMLRIYVKRYRLESLQSLIPESLPLMLTQETGHIESSVRTRRWDFEQSVVPVVDSYASGFGGKPTKATSGILATMLRAYIKSLRQPYELISLWMYFKHQLENPGPDGNIATQLVKQQKSLIHDAFITEMLKHPGFKRPALEVLGDMLASKLKGATDKSGHPAPTVFTFTILLDRLAASGEQVLANELFQVMQENGVEPNLVTMNVRVKRAAMQQNVVKTVEALAELEASFQPNEFTFKAFGWLNNQTKALKMIEQIITKRKQQLGPDDSVYFEDPTPALG